MEDYFYRGYYDEKFLRFLIKSNTNDKETFVCHGQGKIQELFEICQELHLLNPNQTHEVYELCLRQLKIMNRISETSGNWIVYPLFKVCEQFLHMTRLLPRKKKFEKRKVELLEECGRNIHRSFTLCLNDRNPTRMENRQLGVYSLANLEFEIYGELGNRDMCRNLIKVLSSRELMYHETPLKSHMVKFKYYVGEYYGCYEYDFAKSFEHLNDSLMRCPVNVPGPFRDQFNLIKTRILIKLIPVAMVNDQKYLNFRTLVETLLDILPGPGNSASPGVELVDFLQEKYGNLIQSFLTGDIALYDASVRRHQVFYLQQGVYVAVQRLRDCVVLKRLKRWYARGGNAGQSVVALKGLCGVLRVKDVAQIECQLARLIAQGKMRGYISHGHGAVVLSKTRPFAPRASAVSVASGTSRG
ncbi:hypothetical protein TBLA_0I00830 [Henningerozyma blattae CBS 6284]|uniref:PCI domain-containing protein n=1 Tax=Henningerozyma blattae (strain ATCC 34711 / CBS 6284 / DSM 70876 / NBRC 10599 / NRRL Y-10934 / UCD 77-7) TaxID=1071380 RepID=I2H8P0_HENB6|nr:hypothetical protein TBLA_0I00830 [Tetrapisispora blattae CBS 6284]CCH62742.1 hypothetical protein TBLA_0I00830 [Tetrapisispora blattae CBS 6284]